jgi:DNA-binding transcriptional LysR family regulator
MSDIVTSDDLELVLAVARTGSVGAAARRLQVAQPSASQRLSRLERRAGLVLFERDTQGTRPTPAGAELARQADHILGHLGGALEAARAADRHAVRRIGTISSLAELVLPAMDAVLSDAGVEQHVEHGDRLVEWLEEGTIDAAVLAIAGQVELPRTVRRHRIGTDELVVLLPVGVRRPATGSRPLLDRDVVFATYDASTSAIRDRLVGLGARPRRCATVQTALATARKGGCPAVVPRSLAQPRGRERVAELPWRHRLVLDLLVPRRADPAIVAAVPALRRELGLRSSRFSGAAQDHLAE